jgi:hypothetical protein
MKSARLEAYLVLLQRELRKRGIEDARILEEVRGHLADAVERGLHLGLSVDVAEREALTQFGAADTVAAHFVRGRSGMLRRSLDGLASAGRTVRRLLTFNTKAAQHRRTQAVEEFHDREVSTGPRRSRWLLKARDTASILFPEASDDRSVAIVDSDTTATDRLRQLIVGAAAGTTDPALIAAGAREQWLPALAQHLGPALGRMGNLTSLTLLEEKRVRTYRTAFTGRANVLWTVVHASDGTILSLARIESSE